VTDETKRFYKRDEWPKGEWDNEPDEGGWVDEKTKLQCAFVRNSSGALCGYVGVPKTNKHYGKGYDSIEIEGSEWGPEVHGGLTYSADSDGSFLRRYVPTLPEGLWWFGFDCAHCNDVMPGMMRLPGMFEHSIYKNLAYVKAETASLAAQLAGLKTCEETPA
jgi:hypothetical protein